MRAVDGWLDRMTIGWAKKSFPDCIRNIDSANTIFFAPHSPACLPHCSFLAFDMLYQEVQAELPEKE